MAQNISSGTYTMPSPTKQFGWCDENKIEHSWKDGPTFTTNPPVHTRFCVNCGKRQLYKPGFWEDAPR